MQLIVLQPFYVWVPSGKNADGTDKPDRRQSYSPGQTLQSQDVPEGQSTEDWIEKGLVREA